MFETFLNFSQLKMSFSWRVNPEPDKKFWNENFEKTKIHWDAIVVYNLSLNLHAK